MQRLNVPIVRHLVTQHDSAVNHVGINGDCCRLSKAERWQGDSVLCKQSGKGWRACSGGRYSILRLNGARGTALLRCALCYAAREVLHTDLLPGLLGYSLQQSTEHAVKTIIHRRRAPTLVLVLICQCGTFCRFSIHSR